MKHDARDALPHPQPGSLAAFSLGPARSRALRAPFLRSRVARPSAAGELVREPDDLAVAANERHGAVGQSDTRHLDPTKPATEQHRHRKLQLIRDSQW